MYINRNIFLTETYRHILQKNNTNGFPLFVHKHLKNFNLMLHFTDMSAL